MFDRSFCLGRLHGTGRRREQKEGGQAERCDEEQHDMSTLESEKDGWFEELAKICENVKLIRIWIMSVLLGIIDFMNLSQRSETKWTRISRHLA
jgi:hypothetical protein